MKSTAIILAAGMGTRMKSKLPKVMHSICGKPMIGWIIDGVKDSGIGQTITVLGHGGEIVGEYIGDRSQIVYQKEQLGTGHAVMVAAELLQEEDGVVMVLCGDTPLLRKETLEEMLQAHFNAKATVTVMTAQNENPFGYGRIVREADGIKAIVEEKDADEETKKITEINAGTYCFEQKFLLKNLKALTPNNAQGEYYLTDLIKIAVDAGLKVAGFQVNDFSQTMGVNNRVQLAQAQKVMQGRILTDFMLKGVTITDPTNTYIDGQVEIGMDTVILPGCMISGKTKIGSDCVIGPDCKINDCTLGDGCQVQKSVLTESVLGDRCNVGPFAYVRPGCEIAEEVKVGHFVEVKKSSIGRGSKVPHLSYIGDAEIGSAVNIGCGTITCNYDGVNKYKTVVKDKAFVGSNTNLVAPITVEEGAFVAAGSTLTKDVPPYSLSLTRAPLVVKENWVLRKQQKEQ